MMKKQILDFIRAKYFSSPNMWSLHPYGPMASSYGGVHPSLT